MQYPK